MQPEFEDGNLRKLNDRQKKWFVYDQFFKVDGENSVYVRGVTSITDVEEKFYVTMRIALLSLPLMLVVTVLAGFYFTGRTLLPVKQMTGAVKKIRKKKICPEESGLKGTEERMRSMCLRRHLTRCLHRWSVLISVN